MENSQIEKVKEILRLEKELKAEGISRLGVGRGACYSRSPLDPANYSEEGVLISYPENMYPTPVGK